ncbi:MAG TPA: hypothetical protein ENN03_02200 [bacterium]|nr:hypothetical protein [bacterium]
MKKAGLLSGILVFAMFSVLWGQDIIRGTYTYTWGDSESLVEARKICKDLALREAIESYYIFILSSTEVENYQLKDDLIQTVAAGYARNISIIEQKEEGRTLTVTVEALVDPEEIQQLVNRQIREMGRQTEESSEETGEDQPEEAPDSAAESRLFDRAVEFERRLQRINGFRENRQYQAGLIHLEDLKATFGSIALSDDRSPGSIFFRVIQGYVDCLKELMEFQLSISKPPVAAPRTPGRGLTRSGVELRKRLAVLEKYKPKKPERRRLQELWVRRSHELLNEIREQNLRIRRR